MHNSACRFVDGKYRIVLFDNMLPNDLVIYGCYADPTRARLLKVARYSFSGSIPLKFEHKLRHQKQSLEKLPPQLY